MTDNEIIKALECCKMFYAEHNNFHCNDCPINDCKECETKLFSNALDLINRQQAEIERLQKTIDKLKLDMSYMSSPNAIGDKHEMGCW